MHRTVTVVLGGGRGTRLKPLTDHRAKPAVPLAGKYRLIDISISNAINSGLREIYVLTQFNSASLNAHLAKTYRFDKFSRGFVEVLAAEQTEASDDWYQGTADAVRQQLRQFLRPRVSHVLILSGDHLYRMDYAAMVQRHIEAEADITLATMPVPRDGCDGLGVLAVDAQGMVTAFCEKPHADDDITQLQTPPALREAWGISEPHLASMGVYIFKKDVLVELLDTPHNDFGRDILPAALSTHRLAAHRFQGYWEDIGTIGAFYQANLMLCDLDSPFRFYDDRRPIYTRARFLPPSLLHGTQIDRAIVADGCLLLGGTVHHSVIGLRTVLSPGCLIEDSVVMGCDFYEDLDVPEHPIPMGIGRDAVVRRAIIDKNARIGAGARIIGHPNRPDEEHDHWMVRDGIVIVCKNARIAPGAVL